MIKKTLSAILSLTSLICAPLSSIDSFMPAMGAPQRMQPTPQAKSYQLVIHNRPLLKVGESMISLHDVLQKVNLMILAHDPEYLDNPQALFHIYQQYWKGAFEELVNAELMALYWTDKKFVLPETEIRAALNDRFGPNVVDNLNKMGLSYEQALAVVHKDLMVQQINWYFIHMKALGLVTPEKIKTAYQAYLNDFIPSEQWAYEVVSIKGDDLQFCQKVALEICQSASAESSPLLSMNDLLAGVKESFKQSDKTVTVSVQNYTHDKNAIASRYTEALRSIPIGSLSQPIIEGSPKKPIVKLIKLQQIQKEEPKAFQEMAPSFEQQIFQKVYSEEMSLFIKNLQEQYGYTDPLKMIPEDYVPFELIELDSKNIAFNHPQKVGSTSSSAKIG